MFRKLLPVCVLAALVATVLPTPAQAQRTVKFYDAYAYFYDAPGECEYFETYLEVFESWLRHERGRTEHTIKLSFQSLQYEACEDVPLSYVEAFLEIPASDFRFQGLKSASLQLATGLTDWVRRESVPVRIDLTWSCQEEKPYHGGCGRVELSGTVLVGTRNLLDSEFIVGDLVSFKQP